MNNNIDIALAKNRFKNAKKDAIRNKDPFGVACALYGQVKLYYGINIKYTQTGLDKLLKDEMLLLETIHQWEKEYIGELYVHWYNLIWFDYEPEKLEYSNEDILNAKIYFKNTE